MKNVFAESVRYMCMVICLLQKYSSITERHSGCGGGEHLRRIVATLARQTENKPYLWVAQFLYLAVAMVWRKLVMRLS